MHRQLHEYYLYFIKYFSLMMLANYHKYYKIYS